MTFNYSGSFSFLAALAALTFITGCATAPATADPEKLSSIKRLGVISIVGDVLSEYQIGRTAFGNDQSKTDISAFELDDAWESDLAAQVAALNRFDVVDLESDS